LLSPAVGALVAYLEEAWGWVDDIPPLQQVRTRGGRGGEERKTGGRQGGRWGRGKNVAEGRKHSSLQQVRKREAWGGGGEGVGK